ncbi:transcription initiation factor IID, 18kD subunit-domain-containing protein [Lentinula raphanica]|uniref:Transcription initiation factor TFIID subunit 13 n=1 Tax=Lentinula raphanica TaxID=153919 RepID=A0AA38PLU0_9AGAR|nr:transcription initiation factor IID, 18kD subunit-domain-containing protein [Lentinula raphanica]KAJ3779277.1 transcription initiation factor IID, 18kD subunit-domain-containing protein [Lentinula raphanica]KAJ3829025.1 transcription initiation factor IID, 18kD subunit-domain-containing protein [Lentinula raphanica]KAJ3845081.1 transcription initiation factor IID, 18kD subunit-domain-containing protein [Lentinula raphanica]
MSYYPPPVTPGTQPAATTATYSYGAYQPYYYQWPSYSYAIPQQTAARPAQPVAQTTATVPTATPIPTYSTQSTYSTQRPSTYTPYTSYTTSSTTTSRSSRKQSSTKGLFTKELRNLMYGFGDDRNPANDTVNVMEEILVEYIADVCQAAAGPGRKGRLSIEDLRRALSRPADAKKLARMEELLFAQEDIKRARQQFETDPKMA